MQIVILAVGKLTARYCKDGVADYSQRIRGHCSFEIQEVPQQDGKCENPQQREGELLLNKLGRLHKTDCYCIVLSPWQENCNGMGRAERPGKPEKAKPALYNSEQFAAHLKNCQSRGYSRFYFLVGGSTGLSPQVQNAAQLCWAFSPLTFPHQLFRLLLCEQIYRALKINSNQTYHK